MSKETIVKYLKDNKKPIIAIAATIIILIVGFTTYNISRITTGELPFGAYVENDFSLDSSATETHNPLMCDFVNGCIGLNDDAVDMVKGGKYIYCTKEGSSKYYFASMSPQQGDFNMLFYLPKYSTDPIKSYLSDKDKTAEFHNDLTSNLGNGVELIEENGYQFYIVDMFKFNPGYGELFHTDLTWLMKNNNKGKTLQMIEGGMGYPTDTIRKKCNLSDLKSVSNINFNDSFWDKVNYKECFKVFKVGSRTDYCVLSPVYIPIVSGSNTYEYSYYVDGERYSMNAKDLSDWLQEEGYESIQDALQNPQYTPEYFNDS